MCGKIFNLLLIFTFTAEFYFCYFCFVIEGGAGIWDERKNIEFLIETSKIRKTSKIGKKHRIFGKKHRNFGKNIEN